MQCRGLVAAVAAALFVAAIASPLYAQSYPNKPIRLILPMAPGGPTDILGRIIQTRFVERLGQTVVPDNRAGAGSNVGTEIAVKARPDGYTLLLVSPALATSPALYKKLNYDPINLAPISLVAQAPLALVVRPSLPVKNLKELIDYARRNPGKLTFGTSGVGAAPHLAWELLKSLTKTDMVHVPYKGAAPALVGLMSAKLICRYWDRRWCCLTSRPARSTCSPCSAANVCCRCPMCRPRGKRGSKITW